MVREHLVTEWGAQITDGIESDDALGIEASCNGGIIASIDKDLLQVPGEHYHFVKREFISVSHVEGWRNFYTQLLVGDSSDDIPGCRGIGKGKAPRLLEFAVQPEQMYAIVAEAYTKAGQEYWELLRNAQLLYVQRKEGDSWIPPVITRSQPQA